MWKRDSPHPAYLCVVCVRARARARAFSGKRGCLGRRRTAACAKPAGDEQQPPEAVRVCEKKLVLSTSLAMPCTCHPRLVSFWHRFVESQVTVLS